MDADKTILVPAGEHKLIFIMPDVPVLMERAQRLLTVVEGLLIDNAAMYEAAGTELVAIKTLTKEIDGEREELKKPILMEGRAIDSAFKGPLEILAKAATALNAKLTAYRQEQKRIADIEQAKRDREAREERERLAEEARKLAAAGKVEEAEQVVAQAAMTSAVQVMPNVPKVAGISGRKVWKGRITDMKAFLHYAADNDYCWDWITVSAQSLNAQATLSHEKLDIPGVVAEEVESTTART